MEVKGFGHDIGDFEREDSDCLLVGLVVFGGCFLGRLFEEKSVLEI